MNIHRRTLLQQATGAAFATLAPSLCGASSSKIRLGTLVPRGSIYYRQLQAMGEKWKQASAGQVALTIYADGVMGGEAEMVRRIRVGQLQAGLFTTVGMSLIEPAVGGLQNMPMMYRDLGDVDYIGVKLRPMLEKKIEQKGFIVLFWANAGWCRFFTKTPIARPDDLKKLKFFVWDGDHEEFAICQAMGINPVALETADILPGLKTGLISAITLPPFVALASQADTAAPHMLMLNYAPLVGAAVVSKKAWDEIPGDIQAELLKAGEAAGAAIKQQSQKETAEAIAAMQKRGLTVHNVTPEDEAAWRDLLKKAYPQIRGRMVPADVFDEVEQLLNERHKAQGGTP